MVDLKRKRWLIYYIIAVEMKWLISGDSSNISKSNWGNVSRVFTYVTKFVISDSSSCSDIEKIGRWFKLNNIRECSLTLFAKKFYNVNWIHFIIYKYKSTLLKYVFTFNLRNDLWWRKHEIQFVGVHRLCKSLLK